MSNLLPIVFFGSVGVFISGVGINLLQNYHRLSNGIVHRLIELGQLSGLQYRLSAQGAAGFPQEECLRVASDLMDDIE